MSNEIVISVEKIVDTIIRQLQNEQVVKLLNNKGYLIQKDGEDNKKEHNTLNMFTIKEYTPSKRKIKEVELIEQWQTIIQQQKTSCTFLDKLKPLLLENNTIYFIYYLSQKLIDESISSKTTELTNFLNEICSDKIEAKIICSEKVMFITKDDILFCL